jgi:hypothetical protein
MNLVGDRLMHCVEIKSTHLQEGNLAHDHPVAARLQQAFFFAEIVVY